MSASPKVRLDVLLVNKNLISSREKAKRMIMAGLVYVDNKIVDKPGTLINPELDILIKENPNPYVSRGGLKLAKALKKFDFPVEGRTFLDIGASTGGFTDCLLQNGASKVYAIDVGYGQLAWQLRQDSRVVVMERSNIRNITKDDINDSVNGAVVDVSFISLRLVLPVIRDIIKDMSHVIILIKPQFEVGKGNVGKKGVVREKKLHIEVLHSILDYAKNLDFKITNLDFSPVTGPEGNIEFLAHLHNGKSVRNIDISKASEEIVNEAHLFFKLGE